MSESPPSANILLTAADILRWEGDIVRFSQEIEQHKVDIARLEEEREATEKRLQVAKLLAEMIPEGARVAEPAPAPAMVIEKPKKRRKRDTPWPSAILDIVKRGEMGVTFAELRDALSSSSLGPKLDASSKAYHNALARLDKRDGLIVRDYGRVFTPAQHKRFQEALARGEVTIDAERPFAHSPMGTAILKLVWARPGITSSSVIAELRKDPEFNATLTPHKTGAFNIIARLARRNQIVRRDDGGIVPGPKFPKEFAEEPTGPVQPTLKLVEGVTV